MSTIGGMKIATKGSGHTCPGPTPAMSLIPPTPPAGPVPSPFAYIALSSSASKTQSKLKVSGDPVLVKGSKMDVQQPGNIPSNPTGGDVVTHMVNRACGVFTGSSKVKAGGKDVACTGDKCRMNMPMPNGMVAQTIGTLITADALRAAADPSAHAAGDLAVLDPVSVSSGTVVDQNDDLRLPGLIPICWTRHYSTGRLSEHTPMGRGGWTHSYHQHVLVQGRRVELCDADARVITVDDTEVGVPALQRARRLEITRHADGRVFVRSLDTRLTRRYAPQGGTRAYLTEIVEPGGHAVSFEYDDERLARIIDTAGRRIELTHDANGHVVQLAVFASAPGETSVPTEPVYRYDYTYGDDDELIGATDAAGRTERYAYDQRLRLVQKTLPTGLSFHYVYDEETGRCARAWGDGGIHAGVLTYDVEAGITRVSGNEQPAVYAWREDGAIVGRSASDGTASFELAYDDDLHLVESKNAAGDTVRYTYDARGNQTSFTDPLGVTTTFAHVDDLVTRREHAGLVTTFAYDQRGHLTEASYASGARLSLDYDSHGRLAAAHGPDGLRAAFSYDAHHNVIEQRRARGGVERFTYDAMGRTVTFTDPMGRQLRFERDAMGRPVATHYPDGSVERMEYDALGRLVREIDVRGREQLTEYAGLRSPVALGLTDGERFELGFDTLERVVCIENPVGDACHFRYDRAGNVCEMRTFDGRIVRSRRDKAQRPERIELPDGTWRSFSYNAAGDLVEEDSSHGALTLSTSDDGLTFDFVLDDPPGPVLLRLVHDEQTRVVREQQNQHWVEYEYDVQNRCIARRLSTGHETRFEYDEESQVSAVVHDGYRVAYERDAAGSVLRRVHPGCEERFAWDELGRVSRQWVGAGDETLVDRSYRYDPSGLLTGCDDARWGTASYLYDARGRLTEARSQGHVEAFDYDAASSLTHAGATWEILAGNLVTRAGTTSFAHDAGSRRVREQRENGDVFEYQLDCRSRLRQVVMPDRSRIQFTYDGWGRRIRKAIFPVVEIDADAETIDVPPIRTVDFLWSGETMVAEIDSETGTRVFVYEPRGLAPLLQQQGDEIFAVINTPVGTTRELIRPNGTVAWAVKRSVWGNVLEVERHGPEVASPFGLLGQYGDDELHLRYVRFRYFDPAIARFVSPDPLELVGGLNLFAFNGNPTTHADPMGLACILIGDPRSDAFLQWIMDHRTPRPGTFEVYVHGTSTGVWSNTQGDTTPQQLVDRIRAAGNYDGTTPIALNSCNTGRTPTGTGQQVSQAFGTTVYAPNDLVWGQGPATAPGAGPGPAAPGGAIAPGQGWGDRQEYPGHGTAPVVDNTRPGQWNTWNNGQESPGNVYRPTQTYTPPGYTGP